MVDYWELVRPTYLENWPSELCRLSIAQVDVPLALDEARALGSNIVEWGPTFGRRGDIVAVRERVASAVARFPRGAFVRLGSRSPKDSWEGHRHGFKVQAGEDPLRFILDCSERMYEDLELAIRHNYAPHVFVREWIELPAWSEFRCFMRDRRLVGISQYQHLDKAVFPEIAEHADGIRFAIEQFFPAFREASHLDSVVFDVFVKLRQSGTSRLWEVKLLEINPFFEWTDPCLFDWRGEGRDLDGSFRYRRSLELLAGVEHGGG